MKAPLIPTGTRLAAGLAAIGAMYFAMTASKCEQTTELVPFVAEQADKCLDKLDNDDDGRIDCADPDCNAVCEVTLNVDALPAVINTDTLVLTGTQHNATSITVVSLSPQGTGDTPAISGETWSVRLSGLTLKTSYNVILVASNGDRRDTATTTFARGN
jgi:hypothetical protein